MNTAAGSVNTYVFTPFEVFVIINAEARQFTAYNYDIPMRNIDKVKEFQMIVFPQYFGLLWIYQ